MPIKWKTWINLEKYQLLEKQSLTERETPRGPKTMKKWDPLTKPCPHGMEAWAKKPAVLSITAQAGGHERALRNSQLSRVFEIFQNKRS